MPIAVGDQAPQFKAKDQNGVERCLADLGGKPLVLFFYPKDDTPGCTIEACGFRDQYAALQALGAEVWGVSGCLLYTSPSPRDAHESRMPSSA